jgi:hypothetical protein
LLSVILRLKINIVEPETEENKTHKNDEKDELKAAKIIK